MTGDLNSGHSGKLALVPLSTSSAAPASCKIDTGDTVNVFTLDVLVVLIPDTNTISIRRFFSSGFFVFVFSFLGNSSCYFVRENRIEATVKLMGVYESMGEGF